MRGSNDFAGYASGEVEVGVLYCPDAACFLSRNSSNHCDVALQLVSREDNRDYTFSLAVITEPWAGFIVLYWRVLEPFPGETTLGRSPVRRMGVQTSSQTQCSRPHFLHNCSDRLQILLLFSIVEKDNSRRRR